ncbi:hypothetical protein XENOCAPTIV_024634 [Xenoophorus captivus]|uniref:Uncharacterized protein n=1 Tax=Xenoophorus captivus TaxID=1517983 RepID=A0ABV0R390_9TELE
MFAYAKHLKLPAENCWNQFMSVNTAWGFTEQPLHVKEPIQIFSLMHAENTSPTKQVLLMLSDAFTKHHVCLRTLVNRLTDCWGLQQLSVTHHSTHDAPTSV